MITLNLYTRRRGAGSLFIYSPDFNMEKFKYCDPMIKDGVATFRFHNGPKIGNSVTINKSQDHGVTIDHGHYVKIAQLKWLGNRVKNSNKLGITTEIKIVSTDDTTLECKLPEFVAE